jgi:DNA invertase Pin-like site-specific DNA recombinase
MARIAQSSITIALIYTRVSSDEQAREGVSLDAQLAACRRYAAEKGWVLGKEYQDVLSGKRDDRREYQQLLADIRRLRAEGRPLAVVVMRLDRLGRRVLERVRSREELKGLDVPTHSIREGGEVSDLVANILASVAQEEVERLAQRVSDAWEHVRSNGWKQPGYAAFGYRWRPATDDERKRGAPLSVLEIDPEAAALVQEAFTMVDRGASVRAVARRLATLPEGMRRGRAFSVRTTRLLLSAVVYIARRDDDPDRPGNWPPIVERDLYDRVQARIGGHRQMPRQASGRYLLTGLLRCPSCSTRMHGERPKRRGARYRCNATASGGANNPRCDRVVPLDIVDGVILGEIAAILDAVAATDPALKAALGRAWKALSRPSDDTALLRRGQEQVAAKARERIKRLALLFADGEIDRQGYELGRTQAQADLDAATAELATLRTAEPPSALPTLEAALGLAGSWRRVLLEDDTARRRDVLRALVEHVTVERVGYGEYRADVAWTETGKHLRALAERMRRDEHAA